MSDDLISRKAVIDYLREQNNNVIIEKYKDGFVSEDTCRGMESAIRAFRNFILTLPTAFDKEKVITEMKKNSHNFYPSIDHYCLSQKAVDLKKAIEIVEKGGVE